MAEIAMAIINMLARLLNGVAFIATLWPRTLDALSRRVWSKAERIDSGSHLESHAVRLAFDSHGNALALSNEYQTVWAKYFTPDAGWGKAEVIDSTRGSDNSGEFARSGKNHPQVSFDNHGNARAVWLEDTGYDDVLGYKHETWTNRYTRGAGWGMAERFEHTPGETRPVKITYDAQGNALAVWAHFTENRSTLWAKSSRPDTGWCNATPVANTSGDATIMQLTHIANGNALLLWRTDKAGNNPRGLYSVYASYYSATTGWGKTIIISKILNSYQMQTLRLAFDGNSNVIVVWSFEDATDSEKQIHIWAKRYDVTSGWEKTIKIDPGVTSHYSDHVSESVQPEIAFDTRGNAIVVWTQVKENKRGGIWTNRYTFGKGWGAAMPITKVYGEQSRQQLAIDHRGNAIVVWSQKNGVGASYYTFDVGWGEPEQIYEHGRYGYDAFDPQVGFDAGGNATVVWWHSIALYTTIWSRQYNPGKGWTPLTPVTRDYTNKACDPLISFDHHGIAHVTWNQRDLDSSDVHFWTSRTLGRQNW